MLIGQRDYGLRITLDRTKLEARNLTVADIIKSLKMKNIHVEGGKEAVLAVQTLGRLVDAEKLAKFILKTNPDGSLVYLRDVATIELGATGRPDRYVRLDGKPVVALVVSPTPEARPGKLSAALQEKVAQLRKLLPMGLELSIAFDFTPNLEAPGKPTTPEYLLLDPRLPAGASLERVERILARAAEVLRRTRGVQNVLTVTENPFDRFDRFDRDGDRPCILVPLMPAGKREAGRDQVIRAVRNRLFEELRDMSIRVRDLSGPSRFPECTYPVELALGGEEGPKVKELAGKLAEQLRRSKKLTDVWSSAETAPQRTLFIEVDRTKARTMGVSLDDVFKTLQTYTGSMYINDFNRFGRTWRVTVQVGDRPRDLAKGLKQLKVRNEKGDMVPLAALVQVQELASAGVHYRIDKRPAEKITANLAPGVTPAEARKLCESLAAKLGKEVRLVWLR
jgi:multidrug efflux pump subunit AcrB